MKKQNDNENQPINIQEYDQNVASPTWGAAEQEEPELANYGRKVVDETGINNLREGDKKEVIEISQDMIGNWYKN